MSNYKSVINNIKKNQKINIQLDNIIIKRKKKIINKLNNKCYNIINNKYKKINNVNYNSKRMLNKIICKIKNMITYVNKSLNNNIYKINNQNYNKYKQMIIFHLIFKGKLQVILQNLED